MTDSFPCAEQANEYAGMRWVCLRWAGLICATS